MNRELDLQDMEKVTGGWEQFQLTSAERSRWSYLSKRYEKLKEKADNNPNYRDEFDIASRELNDFDKKLKKKYG